MDAPSVSGCCGFVTPILAIFSIAILTLWYRFRSDKFAFFRRIGVPGPDPSIIDGNYRQLAHSGTSPWLVVESWIRKYGKVIGYYRTGPTPFFIISDHEILKEILIKDFSHFTDRSLFSSPRHRLPRIFRGSLTILTGQDWKRVRSTLAPTFTAKKMKAMSPTINEIVDVMLGILESKCQANEITDIYNLFQGLTLDVIGRCAFAADVDCQRNPDEIFIKNVKGIFSSANNPVIRFIQMFPEFNFIISRLMAWVAPNYKRGAAIMANLEQLIEQRKNGKITGHVDMVQLMLDANDDTNPADHSNDSEGYHFSDVRKKYLTEEEMISNSFIFLLAGYETTANCLGFTTYLLAKHPEIQERLFEEIQEIIGVKQAPDYDKVQRLTYLEMVISESLRILPPVVNFVTRVASETMTINGVVIPAKTGVEVPIWHLQHDPDVWEKPEEFNPERFSAENRSEIPAMAYLPFGAGPRNCIGMRFAQLEIKIALVRILQRYRLMTCEKSEPDIVLQYGIATVNPKNGVFIRLEKRGWVPLVEWSRTIS